MGDAPPRRRKTRFAARTGAKGESASALAAVNKAMTSFTLTGAILAGCVRGLRGFMVSRRIVMRWQQQYCSEGRMASTARARVHRCGRSSACSACLDKS